MTKKNRVIEVLKNHHIPNRIPRCASLQLFTRRGITQSKRAFKYRL